MIGDTQPDEPRSIVRFLASSTSARFIHLRPLRRRPRSANSSGEGPQVNPDDGTVSWVAIESRRIHVGHLRDDSAWELLRTYDL